MEAQGEQLLQDLVKHEQALAAKVDEATAAAAEIVQGAEQEAQQRISDAEAKAAAVVEEIEKQTESDSQAVREAILTAARAEVERTAARASSAGTAAVNLILERVLP